ncbi:hypothetical protein C5167_015780 [Papaver somniferum]|uniref:Uncharacterized protein n=1 Tax=Papaver somniferum TaxID=3469 RepID=A0A4Y7JAF7_PAPSO|nr:hypothetical protein C5167_015780 [Papaver somniferum]
MFLKYLIEEMKLDIDVKDNSFRRWWRPAIVVVCVGCFWWDGGGGPTTLLIGHNGVISLLLSKGISIDVSNGFGSPLHLACAFGQHDTVNLLLDHNACPNLLFHEVATSVIHPLHILAMRGEFTQAQFALPRGGDFSHPSFTHLGNAWRIYSSGDGVFVAHNYLGTYWHLLVAAGADTNGGPDGVKALPLAAKVGIIQIIKLLVEAGAGPNFTDMCGLKSVKEAALDGNRQGVEIHFPEHMWMGALMGWFLKRRFFLRQNKWEGVHSVGMITVWHYVGAGLSDKSLHFVYLSKGDFSLEEL